MTTPICTNCGYYYAQWPHSSYCEFCAYQSQVVICSQCCVNPATSVCLCAFPLPMFCSGCTSKHSPPDEHSVQSLSVLSLLKTREQYERHKIRLENIDVVQSKLNMWCKSAVERAKVELAKTVKKLHSLLDSQFEKLKSELEETNKKIDRICQCLDGMKEDYSLQSGTLFDAIVDEGMTETQLRSLESLFEYTANLVDPTYPILSSMIHLIDKIPDVHRQRKVIQEKEANPMSNFSQFKEDLAQYQQPQHVSSQSWSREPTKYARADESAYPPQHSEYQQPVYYSGESVQNPFSLQSAAPEPQLYSEMAPNRSSETVSIPASSQPSNIMDNLPQCEECKRYFSGIGQYCGLMCKQQVEKREQAKAVTLPAQSSQPRPAQNLWFPDQKPEESKQPNRPPPTAGTQDPREESKSVPGNFDNCVWCRKSLAEHKNTAISLLCKHQFHDSECVLLYLKEISRDFRDRLLIKCPHCKDEEEDYNTFMQKAFKSGREFLKRKDKYRRSFCVVCRTTRNISPYECGHMFCPYHMKTSIFCGFCKELKENGII